MKLSSWPGLTPNATHHEICSLIFDSIPIEPQCAWWRWVASSRASQHPKPTFKVPDPIASDGWTVEISQRACASASFAEECRSMYRASGPVEMRPVGEVEFVAGIAAMSASGGYGPIKVGHGIVGFADLSHGDRVEPVLEALILAGGGRLSGVRYSVGYDADPTIGNSRSD